MSEAIPLFVAYLFDAKPIERVQALVNPENEGSAQVLEHSGFGFEGTLRAVHFDRRAYHALRMYSTLRADVPALSSLLAP